ncbi:MAG TPA: hypothetical protein VMH35_25265 [Streptosporangiaceae bacterium]|nr:hypothetical protein [Streptosporangiaceae bacterium]
MGLLNAMTLLAQEWDDVLSYLDPGQVGVLRDLTTQFVAERDADRSGDIAEQIMAMLTEALPVSHPVLTALLSPVDRFQATPGPAADRAWFGLTGPLQARLAASTEIAVDAYLDTDDPAAAARVFGAMDVLVRLLGYDGPFGEQITYGSFFRRAWAIAKSALTAEELTSRLAKVERALELPYLDTKQAEVDTQEAEAAGKLLSSLADIPQACVRVGALLLVKYQEPTGPVVLIRNLSQPEMLALARYPEIQKNPSQALDALALAITSGRPAGEEITG